MGISPYICRLTQMNFFYMWCSGNLFCRSFAFRDALESVGLTGLARSCTCVLVKAPPCTYCPTKGAPDFNDKLIWLCWISIEFLLKSGAPSPSRWLSMLCVAGYGEATRCAGADLSREISTPIPIGSNRCRVSYIHEVRCVEIMNGLLKRNFFNPWKP